MKKKGISLIVLIITIIVVIILAAVVILTISKNNLIESAKEARFKEDVRTFQDELALYISKQYTNAGGHWNGNINAKTYDEIVNYIPSFTKKYEGKFIINNNNLEYTNKLDENEKEYAQNLNVKEKVLKLLPDEYQQVEYIEGTGTQWIDTGINANNNLSVKIEFEASLIKNAYSGFFGARTGMHFESFCIWLNEGNFRFDYGNVIRNVSGGLEIDKRYVLLWDKDKIYLNDDLKTSLNLTEFSSTQTITVFAIKSGNLVDDRQANYKLYNLTISNSEKMLCNFIPCYSTTSVVDVDGKECPSGTIGMYDTVEGKFYTNQGTGDFIAGPEV